LLQKSTEINVVPSPGGYGVSCVQRQTISSSVLQLHLVRKTIVNNVECWCFDGN